MKKLIREIVDENFLKKLFSVIIGNSLAALAMIYFLRPNGMIPAGITGASQLVEVLTHIPLSFLIVLLNLPLIVIGLIVLSKNFMFFSIVAVFVSSFMVGIFQKIAPDFAFTNNILLAAIFGGVINGIGGGISFRNGTSTGGFDILAAVIRKKTNQSIGNVLMILNLIIISLSALIYSVDQALFTLLFLYINYQFSDRIQLGVGRQKQIFIISSKHSEITDAIYKNVNRGVTNIMGEGAYTKNKVVILYLICSNAQLVKVKNIVRDIDDKAFVAVSDTTEIQGHGFKKIEI